MAKTEIYDIGDNVVCDLCNEDYTNSDALGGYIFESKGVCPKCAPEFIASVFKFKEERFIRDRAMTGETFKAFILRCRGGNNQVKITTYSKDEPFP
jgi:hypothetical protein